MYGNKLKQKKDELTPLCKYTNLQPLLSRDNLIKGGRY